MREIPIKLTALHEAQQHILDNAKRFTVVDTGRRFGKTTLGLHEAVHTMLRGGNVGWFAPIYKLIGGEDGMWPKLTAAMPREAVAHVDNSNNTMRLRTGGLIECWSLEKTGAEDSFRGREYDLVVVDEAAFIPDLKGKFDRAIRPTLSDRRGRARFYSTPNGYNDFYDLFEQGQDPDDPDWVSFKAPSNARPNFPADEWRDLLRDVESGKMLRATFSQEYLGDFTVAQGLVLGLDDDGVAIYEPSQNVKPAPCRWDECKWRIAIVDPGGQDPTGLVALGITHDDRYHVFGAERRKGMVAIIDDAGRGLNDWLGELHAAGPLTRIVISETGGEIIRNTLIRLGWHQTTGFVKDRGVKIHALRSRCKSRRLTFAPGVRKLIESEVYTWMFAESKPGRVGHQTWQTVVNTSEHHADVLEALADGITSVEMRYPGVEGAKVVRADRLGGVRRAVAL